MCSVGLSPRVFVRHTLKKMGLWSVSHKEVSTLKVLCKPEADLPEGDEEEDTDGDRWPCRFRQHKKILRSTKGVITAFPLNRKFCAF